jgi:hypothetical protein
MISLLAAFWGSVYGMANCGVSEITAVVFECSAENYLREAREQIRSCGPEATNAIFGDRANRLAFIDLPVSQT